MTLYELSRLTGSDPDASNFLLQALWHAPQATDIPELVLRPSTPPHSWEQAALTPKHVLFALALGDYLRRTGKLK